MNSTSGPPIPDRPERDRLAAPTLLSAVAILLFWLAFAAAYRGSPAGWPLGLTATLTALLSFLISRRLVRERRTGLENAARSAANRNRELELLRGIAATLLSFRSPDDLFSEVARVARLLLRSEGGAVMLRSEVSDFLRVVAGDGMLQAARGRLLPIEGSLSGSVVITGEPLCTDDMGADPRNHPVEGLPPELLTAVVAPLRSRGVVIGTLGAYNRNDGAAFDGYDVKLALALADQVAVGLDRAAMLEDAHRKELALEQKNRELLEATALKSQFLANMSHELRTPLNAIIGFSDLMLATNDGIDPDSQEYLEAIARNGRHLLGLINDVLDTSKLEAGRMRVSLARFDLRQAVRQAVADTESLRAVKRQQCTVDLDEAAIAVNADIQHLRQVLYNFLSNATKFTGDGGTIAISAIATRVPLPVPADRSNDLARLELRQAAWVAVRDTGIGIRQEDLPKLFQPFSQVDASASRQQQGTGLGLSLAKQLVELHGGTIGVESVVGEGSTFWFILPVDGPVRQASVT